MSPYSSLLRYIVALREYECIVVRGPAGVVWRRTPPGGSKGKKEEEKHDQSQTVVLNPS